MSELERPAVKRVRDALVTSGIGDNALNFETSARSAQAAADALECELGAIVKSLLFCIDTRFVMALVAGDHQCIEDNLPKAFNMKGKVRRPQASEVRAITGFSIGGVAPIGLNHPLPMVMDASLKRFDKIYAAAGHPNCIFPSSFSALSKATGALISYNISTPMEGISAYRPPISRSKTFSK